MLDVQWEYRKYNIHISDSAPVAILRAKEYNRMILRVYENREGHYSVLSPDFSFIKSKYVLYHSEADIVEQKYGKEKLISLPAHDVLGLRLEEGCKIIEEDFLEQAERIINLLS